MKRRTIYYISGIVFAALVVFLIIRFNRFYQKIPSPGEDIVVKVPEPKILFGLHADSFHIYGKDIHAAQQRLFDRIKTTTFEERVYHFSDPMIQDIYNEAEAIVREKIREFDAR